MSADEIVLQASSRCRAPEPVARCQPPSPTPISHRRCHGGRRRWRDTALGAALAPPSDGLRRRRRWRAAAAAAASRGMVGGAPRRAAWGARCALGGAGRAIRRDGARARRACAASSSPSSARAAAVPHLVTGHGRLSAGPLARPGEQRRRARARRDITGADRDLRHLGDLLDRTAPPARAARAQLAELRRQAFDQPVDHGLSVLQAAPVPPPDPSLGGRDRSMTDGSPPSWSSALNGGSRSPLPALRPRMKVLRTISEEPGPRIPAPVAREEAQGAEVASWTSVLGRRPGRGTASAPGCRPASRWGSTSRLEAVQIAGSARRLHSCAWLEAIPRWAGIYSVHR